MLEISPSYLNQIEHDVRPLTVAVLLRITEVFGVDATFFASQDDTRLVAELREVTLDRDLGIEVDPSEIADMVSAHPDAGPRDGQPAPALPAHHRAAGRGHRGPVLRRQRQRVDHHAARGGARLLLPAAELPARAGHRRRGAHDPDADAPRRPGPRAVRPADRGARRPHHQADRPRRHRAAPLRPGDQDAGDQQPPLVGPAGVQAGRRAGLPGVRRR